MVMQNPEKFTFFAYAIRRSMVRYPRAKEERIARATDAGGISANEWSNTNAPITAGTLIMKEMARESSCFRFLIKRTVNVVPDLETPGRMEKPWARPRMTISKEFISWILRAPDPLSLRSSPVRIRRAPIKKVAWMPP